MKKLFAICIMALATPASARPWAAFYCGGLQVASVPSKYFDPEFGQCSAPCDNKGHFFDMKKDPEQKRPLSNRLFRTNDDGDLFYKSKKCQEFTADDYDAPPGMSRREIARQRRLRLLSEPEPPPPPPMPTTTCIPHPTLEGYEVCGQAPLVAVGQGYDTGTRPQNPPASDRQPRSAKALFLTLKSDLTLTLGNDPVARDALGSLFDAATGGDKDTPIYLRADRTVAFGEVMRIMELLRAAGYVKFLLVVQESKPQPSTAIGLETVTPPPGLPIPAPAVRNVPSVKSIAPVAPEVALWKSSVVARIDQHKRYPEDAKSRREQGVTQVFFSLDRQGRVLESRVVSSSGANALDEEALALLRRAQPFPLPPQELAGDHVDLTVPIRFNLVK
jgi:TonB family protein